MCVCFSLSVSFFSLARTMTLVMRVMGKDCNQDLHNKGLEVLGESRANQKKLFACVTSFTFDLNWGLYTLALLPLS